MSMVWDAGDPRASTRVKRASTRGGEYGARPGGSGMSIEIGAETAPSRETIVCEEPSTRARLGVVRAATPAGVAEAVRLARVAQARWRESSFAVRRRVLGRVLEHV